METHKVKYSDIQSSDGELASHAFPGGYPLVYVDGYGDELCPGCATVTLTDPEEFDSWRPAFYFIHYEGAPVYCSKCNEFIESAYGDPDEMT